MQRLPVAGLIHFPTPLGSAGRDGGGTAQPRTQ